jgi:hypothetical protein
VRAINISQKTEGDVVSAGVEAEDDVEGIVRSMEKMSVAVSGFEGGGLANPKHFSLPLK